MFLVAHPVHRSFFMPPLIALLGFLPIFSPSPLHNLFWFFCVADGATFYLLLVSYFLRFIFAFSNSRALIRNQLGIPSVHEFMPRVFSSLSKSSIPSSPIPEYDSQRSGANRFFRCRPTQPFSVPPKFFSFFFPSPCMFFPSLFFSHQGR